MTFGIEDLDFAFEVFDFGVTIPQDTVIVEGRFPIDPNSLKKPYLPPGCHQRFSGLSKYDKVFLDQNFYLVDERGMPIKAVSSNPDRNGCK